MNEQVCMCGSRSPTGLLPHHVSALECLQGWVRGPSRPGAVCTGFARLLGGTCVPLGKAGPQEPSPHALPLL